MVPNLSVHKKVDAIQWENDTVAFSFKQYSSQSGPVTRAKTEVSAFACVRSCACV